MLFHFVISHPHQTPSRHRLIIMFLLHRRGPPRVQGKEEGPRCGRCGSLSFFHMYIGSTTFVGLVWFGLVWCFLCASDLFFYHLSFRIFRVIFAWVAVLHFLENENMLSLQYGCNFSCTSKWKKEKKRKKRKRMSHWMIFYSAAAAWWASTAHTRRKKERKRKEQVKICNCGQAYIQARLSNSPMKVFWGREDEHMETTATYLFSISIKNTHKHTHTQILQT